MFRHGEPYGADGAAVPVQKFRDTQKLYAAMVDGNVEYILYGIEAQAETHYAMEFHLSSQENIEYSFAVQ